MSCNLKAGSTDTLQFRFTKIGADVSGFTALRFSYTNFHTPFSAQNFNQKKINVKVYIDDTCRTPDLRATRNIVIQSMNIDSRIVSASDVALETTSKTIAYAGADNVLSFSVTTGTNLDPSGKGKIKMFMPIWYQVGNGLVMPYSNRALDKCTCDCFTTKTSALTNQHIEIEYTDMTQACMNGGRMTIKCEEYKNPIY